MKGFRYEVKVAVKKVFAEQDKRLLKLKDSEIEFIVMKTIPLTLIHNQEKGCWQLEDTEGCIYARSLTKEGCIERMKELLNPTSSSLSEISAKDYKYTIDNLIERNL